MTLFNIDFIRIKLLLVDWQIIQYYHFVMTELEAMWCRKIVT